jgi:hypothetical protein
VKNGHADIIGNPQISGMVSTLLEKSLGTRNKAGSKRSAPRVAGEREALAKDKSRKLMTGDFASVRDKLDIVTVVRGGKGTRVGYRLQFLSTWRNTHTGSARGEIQGVHLSHFMHEP